MKNKHLWMSLAVGVVIAGGSLASNVTLPNVFQPNTPARASEVNANFTAVKSAVDDNFSLVSAAQAAIASLAGRVSALESTSCTGNGANDAMVRVGTLCVDKYEASVWSGVGGTGTQYGVASNDYPATFPANGAWSTKLYAASIATAVPSSFITWFQAAQACAAAGKRLPTNAEWQTFAGGSVPDTRSNCNLGAVAKAVPGANCESGWGVVNTTGNVSEYTADWVTGNKATWSPGGITTLTAAYGNNWVTGMQLTADTAGEALPNAVIRGGDFTNYRGGSASTIGGGSPAGPWRIWAETSPTRAEAQFGFRCVK